MKTGVPPRVSGSEWMTDSNFIGQDYFRLAGFSSPKRNSCALRPCAPGAPVAWIRDGGHFMPGKGEAKEKGQFPAFIPLIPHFKSCPDEFLHLPARLSLPVEPRETGSFCTFRRLDGPT